MYFSSLWTNKSQCILRNFLVAGHPRNINTCVSRLQKIDQEVKSCDSNVIKLHSDRINIVKKSSSSEDPTVDPILFWQTSICIKAASLCDNLSLAQKVELRERSQACVLQKSVPYKELT